jgi:hypothetical protein
VHLDVQQNLDVQILDAIQPYLDVARHFPVHLRDVVVGVEPLHLLKRDYFLDVVGVEPLHQLKMDYFLDVEPVRKVLVLQLLELHHFLLHVRQLHALPPLPY